MSRSKKGTIVCIGGKEDKEGDRTILKEIAKIAGKGKFVVSAVASGDPEPLYEVYDRVFKDLGIHNIEHLDIRDRRQSLEERSLAVLNRAKALFFTGGDQLRITSQLGGTALFEKIRSIYLQGGLIAGTSAGASVVCSTMLVSGKNQESYKIGDLTMGPGLGLIDWAIIDQHFAERGRMGRLLGAIAENPHVLGIGIDEDTAIVCEGDEDFYVVGDGAVSVVDGVDISYSNIAEDAAQRTVSIYDVKIHVLSEGDGFRLADRRPYKRKKRTSSSKA